MELELEAYRRAKKRFIRESLPGWWREEPPQFADKHRRFAEELGVAKEEAEKILARIDPSKPERFREAKDCTVFELSWESGVNLKYLLPKRPLATLLLCSPFIGYRDYCDWLWVIREGEFRVITWHFSHRWTYHTSEDWIPPMPQTVRLLPVHAKLLVALTRDGDGVGIVSSANLNIKGESTRTREIGVRFGDPEVVEHLRRRFEWWWEEAGVLEQQIGWRKIPKPTEPHTWYKAEEIQNSLGVQEVWRCHHCGRKEIYVRPPLGVEVEHV